MCFSAVGSVGHHTDFVLDSWQGSVSLMLYYCDSDFVFSQAATQKGSGCEECVKADG